jgi:Bacteriophage translational regulator
MISLDLLLEVILTEEENFLKIKETLTRIGIASRKEKRLYQSCHILHKKGKYYITHFKELFLLDGKHSDFTDEDKGRRNTIASLLEEWGLIKVINQAIYKEPRIPLNQIKVLSYKEKLEWELESKYTVGKKRN